MAKIYYKGRDYSRAIGGSGGGGGSVDSTDVPTAGKVSEFDSNAHINSEDMSSQDVEDFLADINAQGTPSEYKKLLWTNASPSSAFAAQTILSDVDLTEYDEFEIEVRNYITGDIYNICRFENASQRQIWVFDTSNFTGSTIPVQLSRIINISSSGMAISNGYSKPYNSTSAPSNSGSICLPIKVYGIKYEKVAPIQVNASDYVIEQGTDGIWTYRKWESGVAECWGIKTESVACSVISSPWIRGSMSATNFPSGLFIAKPAVLVSGYASSWMVAGTTTETSIAYIYVYDVSTGTATRYANIHAIGRWK